MYNSFLLFFFLKKCFLLKRKPVHFSKLWWQAQISLSICWAPKSLLLLWTSSWTVLAYLWVDCENLNISTNCFSFNSYYYNYDLFLVNSLLFTWYIHKNLSHLQSFMDQKCLTRLWIDLDLWEYCHWLSLNLHHEYSPSQQWGSFTFIWFMHIIIEWHF